MFWRKRCTFKPPLPDTVHLACRAKSPSDAGMGGASAVSCRGRSSSETAAGGASPGKGLAAGLAKATTAKRRRMSFMVLVAVACLGFEQ